jgi:ABC-type Fe3+ transport system substrate-binding protein
MLAALAMMAGTGCSSKTAQDKSAAPIGKLIVISPHWEGIRAEFDRGFSEWLTANKLPDVKITWLDQGGTSDDMKFIRAGFSRSPQGIDVDVFYGGGLDPYIELADAGLLEPFRLPDEELARIPSELNGMPLYDKQFRWHGASLAGFGILYNKKLLEMYKLETPDSWEDLANPAFKDMVGSSDPRHSGSVHMMYEIILQASGGEKGWDILTRIGGNVRNFPKSSGQIGKDLATGEVAAGLSIDTYAFSAIEQAGADLLGFVLPARATVITPDPVAILKGAPNMDNARLFVRFCVSPEGQRLWMLKKGVPGGPVEFSLNKMSILPELYPEGFANTTNVTVNPFAMEGGFVYDFEKGAARWELLNDMVGALIIDTHVDLADGWKRVAAKGKALPAATFAPPVSEERALELARTSWKDPVERNKIATSWFSDARKRYKGLK